MSNKNVIAIIKEHLLNIYKECSDFINQDPMYSDPGNNYEEISYIYSQCEAALQSLDLLTKDKDSIND